MSTNRRTTRRAGRRANEARWRGPEALETRTLLSGGAPAGRTHRVDLRAIASPPAPEVVVNAKPADARESEPSVAVAPRGGSVVAWRQVADTETGEEQANPSGIKAQRYDRLGRPQGPRIDVDGALADFGDPSAATDRAGRFVVAYSQGATDLEEVDLRRYRADGSPRGGPIVLGWTSGQINDVRVALDDRGGFVVVWRDSDSDEGNSGIFGQRFGPGGRALGSEFRANAISAGDQIQPDLAVAPGGAFAVTWKGPDPSNPAAGAEIFARTFGPGGRALGPEFVVNTTSAGDQRHPSIAIDRQGRFVIAWESLGQDGRGLGVYARRFGPLGKHSGAEFRVNTTTQGDQSRPDVAVDPSGSFVIGWQGTGPGDWRGIFAQRFDAAGRPVGGQFRLNDRTDDLQTTPSLGLDARGRLVGAWTSLGQAGGDFATVARFVTPSQAADLEATTSDGRIFDVTAEEWPAYAAAELRQALAPTEEIETSAAGPDSTFFAVVGDFGYSASDEEQNTLTSPEDYVAAAIRGVDPAFIVALGDDNYILGRDRWFDRNVGKNYAPYITPYLAQESYGQGYPNGIPGVPPASYNRFFSVPGNHDYHDPFTSHLNPATGRGRTFVYGDGFDQWFLPAISGSPAVRPLAASYVNLEPYSNSYSDFLGGETPYYDYLLKPIGASGAVLPRLANLYLIDGYQDVNGASGAGPSGPQARQVLATAASRPDGAAWQIAAMHYQILSSTTEGGLAGMNWDFAGNGVDLVLTAHVHDYERLAANGITYLVEGTGGFNFGTDPFNEFTNPPLPQSQARSIGFGALTIALSPTQLTGTQFVVDTSGPGPVNVTVVDQFTLSKSSTVHQTARIP